MTIPLDGTKAGSSWGGANDGKIHPPLQWDALLLVDSATTATGGDGVLLIGAPHYVIP